MTRAQAGPCGRSPTCACGAHRAENRARSGPEPALFAGFARRLAARHPLGSALVMTPPCGLVTMAAASRCVHVDAVIVATVSTNRNAPYDHSHAIRHRLQCA